MIEVRGDGDGSLCGPAYEDCSAFREVIICHFYIHGGLLGRIRAIGWVAFVLLASSS
jgi:hypothetical protein